MSTAQEVAAKNMFGLLGDLNPEPTRILKYTEDQDCYLKFEVDTDEKEEAEGSFPYKFWKSIDVTHMKLSQQKSLLSMTESGVVLIGHRQKVAKIWCEDDQVMNKYMKVEFKHDVSQIELLQSATGIEPLYYAVIVNNETQTLYVCLDDKKLRTIELLQPVLGLGYPVVTHGKECVIAL